MKIQIEAINGVLKDLQKIPAIERTEAFAAALGGLRHSAEKLAEHVTVAAQRAADALKKADEMEAQAKKLREQNPAPTTEAPKLKTPSAS
jgi:hypothetical protein